MAKIKLKSLTVDLKKEREGDWIKSTTFVSDEGPATYLLRSTNYPEYMAATRKVARTMAQKIRDGKEISEDEAFAEEGARICEHLLLGWGNMDEDYTPELALSLLTNPEYRPLLNDIMACADRVGRNAIEFVKVDVKN